MIYTTWSWYKIQFTKHKLNSWNTYVTEVVASIKNYGLNSKLDRCSPSGGDPEYPVDIISDNLKRTILTWISLLVGVYRQITSGIWFGGVTHQAVFLVCYCLWCSRWWSVICSVDIMECWRLLRALFPAVTLSLFSCFFVPSSTIPLSSSQPLLSFHPCTFTCLTSQI